MSSVEGPDGSDPTESGGMPNQIQTGMSKMYTSEKAPGFKEWMTLWFGPSVTPEMVTAFEQNMMQMIQTSMQQSQKQHEKVQQEIKKRIEEQ